MATIKGQNLRIYIANKCVGASTSCSLHCVANVEAISTKDDEGDFVRNQVVSLSWDATVDALVTNGKYDEATLNTGIVFPGSGGEAFYSDHAFTVHPGETISINSAEAYVGFATASSPLTPMEAGANEYTNEGTTALTIYALSDTENAEVNVYITDPERTDAAALITAMQTKQPVAVKLATTTGRSNLKEDVLLLSGSAIIADMSLTAQNRTTSTYSLQLTGTDDLNIEEE